MSRNNETCIQLKGFNYILSLNLACKIINVQLNSEIITMLGNGRQKG
jgi:hypothetical protein